MYAARTVRVPRAPRFLGVAVRHLAAMPLAIRAYLCITWAIFAVVAMVDFDGRRHLADPYGYRIADLGDNLPHAFALLPVATFINVGVLQILYVTVLLVAVSPLVGARSRGLAGAVFVGTSVAAALIAGIGLYLLSPQINSPILDEAWARRWNGGSAGCYGLIGFVIAPSRHRWLLLTLVATWEVALTGVHLHSYTPAFHVSALVTGFAAGLCWVRWKRRRPVVTVPDAIPALAG